METFFYWEKIGVYAFCRVSQKKWHYRNDLIVLKPLLNARDYTPGNLMNLYLHLSILKRFRFVQIF
jgi:hypothetical protein